MPVNQIWCRESPFYMTVGEALAFSYVWEGTGAAITAGATTVYRDGTAKATMLSGSDSSSGRTQTIKTFTPTEEGKYVLVITATVDSNTEIRKLLIYVQPVWMEQ